MPFQGNATAGTAALTGGLSMLLGGGMGPNEDERRRLYGQQTGALRGQINTADANARAGAMRSATTAVGGGNPFLAGRLGAQAGGDAAAHVQAQGLQQQSQLGMQQAQQEMAARTAQSQAGMQRVGSLLGAGGQVLGMAIPAFGALRGVAGATGATGALSGSGNPIGGLMGSALGGGAGAGGIGGLLGGSGGQGPAAPQAATPQVGIGSAGFGTQGLTAPPGMRWDPTTNGWVPI